VLELYKARLIEESRISEETQISILASQIQKSRKGSSEELRLQKEKITVQLVQDSLRIEREISNEILKNAKLNELQEIAVSDKIALDATYAESQKQKDKEVAENKRTLEQQRVQDFQNAADTILGIANQLNSILGTVDQIEKQRELKNAGSNAKKREEIEKKFFEKAKQRQITQISIDTIAGAIKAYMGALAFDPTTVTSTILAALVAAQGAVAIAQVSAQKFAYGGIVQGQGQQDNVPAMLTPGEMIMRKDAVQKYGGVLSEINQSVGGKGIGGISASRIATDSNYSDLLKAIAGSQSKIVTVRDLITQQKDYNVTNNRTSL
jgi:hypothetical protein